MSDNSENIDLLFKILVFSFKEVFNKERQVLKDSSPSIMSKIIRKKSRFDLRERQKLYYSFPTILGNTVIKKSHSECLKIEVKIYIIK